MYVVSWMALWTIATNACVVFEWPYAALKSTALPITIAAGLITYWLGKPSARTSEPLQRTVLSQSFPYFRQLSIAAGMTLVAITLYQISSNEVWIWSIGLILSFAALLLHPNSPEQAPISVPQPVLPDNINWNRIALVAVFAGYVVYTFFAYRPDRDNAFYAHLSAYVLAHKDAPFLQVDVMHGLPELPLNGAWYRVHSFEMMAALISDLVGMPPIYTLQLVITPFASVLAFLVLYYIFNNELRIPALVGAIAFFAIVVFWDDVHRAYGTWTFTRFTQGKGILITMWVPLFFIFARQAILEFSLRKITLFVFTLIAGVGITANSLIVLPLTFAAVFFSTAPMYFRSKSFWLRILVLGAICAGICGFYFLVIALMDSHFQKRLMGIVHRITQEATNPERASDAGQKFHQFIKKRYSWKTSVGGTNMQLLVLVSLMLLPFISIQRKTRTVLASFSALYFFLMSPAGFLVTKAFFPINFFWRGFWAVPVPFYLAMAAAGSWPANRLSAATLARFSIAPVIILCVFLFNPGPGHPPTQYGPVWIALDQEYSIASTVDKLLKPGDMVLTDDTQSWKLSAYSGQLSLVRSRSLYLLNPRKFGGLAKSVEWRNARADCMTTPRKCKVGASTLIKELQSNDYQAILMRNDHPLLKTMQTQKSASGLKFTPVANYVLVTRSQTAKSASNTAGSIIPDHSA